MSADISTIVTRLESVTTRLEGLAAAGGVSGGGSAVECEITSSYSLIG